MTLVLGALDGEIEQLVQALHDRETETRHGQQVHTGSMADRPVVIAKSGVGKVYSAAVAQHLIDRYEPARVIFTGVAGALNPDYEIGDMLVARDCMQYDMDASALGFARGEVPYTEFREFACDPELVRAASSVPTEIEQVHVGRILTGDRFVTTADEDEYAFLRRELFGDAVEMEGAAVGMVAALNELPFVVVRTISDRADAETGKAFADVLDRAAAHARALVRHILQNL
jgi:5'-methylthioadenosine/S-adenosylhomocysteine nucleosidase